MIFGLWKVILPEKMAEFSMECENAKAFHRQDYARPSLKDRKARFKFINGFPGSAMQVLLLRVLPKQAEMVQVS